MANIKIFNVPAGEAPAWVRREWVGLSLPFVEEMPKRRNYLVGVLGGKVDDLSDYGYYVKRSVAIDALSKKSFKAAQWWRENSNLGSWLVFEKAVCKLQ